MLGQALAEHTEYNLNQPESSLTLYSYSIMHCRALRKAQTVVIGCSVWHEIAFVSLQELIPRLERT